MTASHEALGWSLGQPLSGDRAVAAGDTRLDGVRVALLVSGGIAACRTPMLARSLRKSGAEVVAVVTPNALKFVAEQALAWCCQAAVITALDDRAQHVEMGKIDVYLLAPATYSTIAKLAHGIADNAVTTTLASALGHVESGQSKVLIAPAMHGSMVNPVLVDNLRRVQAYGCEVGPPKGEDGKAKLPDDDVLVAALAASVSAATRT